MTKATKQKFKEVKKKLKLNLISSIGSVLNKADAKVHELIKSSVNNAASKLAKEFTKRAKKLEEKSSMAKKSVKKVEKPAVVQNKKAATKKKPSPKKRARPVTKKRPVSKSKIIAPKVSQPVEELV